MIQLIKGDLFEAGAKLICHQVNCQGVMGSGVAIQVKQKFPHVFNQYQVFCEKNKGDLLGKVLYVKCEQNSDSPIICNLFAQDQYGYDGNCYTSYDSLQSCFNQLEGLPEGEKIAMPYLMGCHRGGGDWNIVMKMIENTFKKHDVLIYQRGE